jgi:hypothetical protein
VIDASFNEVEALVTKAARGAGLPWGLAEEAARAARWLAGFDLPWPETLLALLAEPDGAEPCLTTDGSGSRLTTAGDRLSPLRAGPWLVDVGLAHPVHLAGLVAPLWLLPFAAQAAALAGRPVQLGGPGVGAIVERSRFALLAGSIERLAAAQPTEVTVATADRWEPAIAGRERAERARVAPAAWDALERLGARTYVPATARSRALGAGAGERDDD